MEDAEIHHDRAALAGVVRELEAQPAIDRFLLTKDPRRTKRLRQAVGVVVRIIMEQRGWKKTGEFCIRTGQNIMVLMWYSSQNSYLKKLSSMVTAGLFRKRIHITPWQNGFSYRG